MKSSKETDKKTKLIQEKCNTILGQLLRDDDNKYCCDCDSKGPRWASWNLGIFLCIRCAGIHRNLGVHISKVKSVNLDSWQPEQVVSLQQMGNSRARAVYESGLADNFRRPQTDSGLESFIRAKYEHKKYIAREWVPPVAVKVDWDKEIEEEIENQKRKKKTTGIATISEPTKSAPSPVNIVNIAPLPKPHSPKNSRVEVKKAATVLSSSADLLGIGFGTEVTPVPSVPKPVEIFDFFANVPVASPVKQQIANGSTDTNSSLKQEEHDFFNQKSLENGGNEKGKMTKQSILALYGTAPTFSSPAAQAQAPFNGSFQAYPSPRPPQEAFLPFGQPPPAAVGNFGNFNANFATVQTQQMNKLNEENIKKIESLNFNNFK